MKPGWVLMRRRKKVMEEALVGEERAGVLEGSRR